MAHPYKYAAGNRAAQKRANAIMKANGGGIGADKTPLSSAAGKRKASGGAVGKRAAGANKVADMQVSGSKGAKRFKRGGKVKGHQTNIAIVTPHPGAAGAPMAGGPPGMPPGGPPGIPPGMPPGAPPGMAGPPGMRPPGMARGGAAKMTAGAFTGVGRKQKAGG